MVQNLWLFGGSQGGMITVLAAEERAACIRGLILYFPALCIPDDWRRAFPDGKYPEEYPLWGMTLGRAYFADACALDVFSRIGGFSGPVRIVHGTQDTVVPAAYSRRAAAKYPDAQLTLLPGEGHGFTAAGEQTVRELFVRLLSSLG